LEEERETSTLVLAGKKRVGFLRKESPQGGKTSGLFFGVEKKTGRKKEPSQE